MSAMAAGNVPVEVLSCLFRGMFLAKLVAAHRAGRLKFFAAHARLDNIRAFNAYLAPLRNIDWVVYAKRPFVGPRACSPICRATPTGSPSPIAARGRPHRRHLPVEELPDRGAWPLSDHDTVDPRVHPTLPDVRAGGFHRIRHYGLLASGSRAANIARARELLAVPVRSEQQDASEAPAADEPRMLPRPCPCCAGRMFIIETFARGSEPKHRPAPAPAAIRIDTS